MSTETQQVKFDGKQATLTVKTTDGKTTWMITGDGIDESGEGALSLMALLESKRLSMSGGRRRKTHKSRRHQRKTRRSRK